MKRLLTILLTIAATTFVGNQATAQSLTEFARQADQRSMRLKAQERARYDEIIDSRDLDLYNEFIADYPRSKNTVEIKNRAEEIKLWKNAQLINSISAYEKYLNETHYRWYAREAQDRLNSLKQVAEKKAWNKVVASNTLSAYEQYLNDNPSSGYRKEAQIAINRIKGAAEWQKLKYSTNISEIQNFIDTYPNATELSTAQSRLHELKALDYYNKGDLKSAYNEFNKADISYNASYAHKKEYDEVKEYHEFSLLDPYSFQSSLEAFLKKYPHGKYSSQVSNMLAISMAKKLSDYATTADYNRALSYAKDASTQTVVNTYIDNNKYLQKQRHKLAKAYERSENGGTFGIGFNFMDIGYNFTYDHLTLWHYDIGLMFRLGNYADRVQFALGVKLGLLALNDEDNEEYDASFHIPVIAQLKLNLFKMSENSRFFIHGLFQYNAFRDDCYENELAWGAGIGFAWKHVDWTFYYRKELFKKDYDDFSASDIEDMQYIGTSLTYYWKL